MRICLIHPPNIVHESYLDSVVPYLSQAIAWLSAALTEAGHQVTVIDALVEGWDSPEKESNGFTYFGLSMEEIGKRIKKADPQLVGIEIPFSTQAQAAIECAGVARKAVPGVPVVVGGNHVSVLPEQTAREENIDYVIVGEGEKSIVALAQSLENGDSLESIDGVGYVDSAGEFHLNPNAPIADLDSMPVPDYQLFPVEKYFRLVGERQMTIVTSRGCPYSCSFCSVHAVHGHRFRARSAGHVLREIELLVDRYRIRDLYIEDDNFSLKRERVEEICRGIIARKWKLRIFFRNGLRADTLDRQLLKLMRKAGTVKIWLAPESGSKRIREKIIRKKLDLRAIENAVKEAARLQIGVVCFFVIGFPDETREEIEETFSLAEKLRSLGAGSMWFSIATPYYGTDLYSEAVASGCLKEVDPALLTTHTASIDGKNLSAAEISDLRERAMLQFNRPAHNSLAGKLLKAIRHPGWALRRFASKLGGEK